MSRYILLIGHGKSGTHWLMRTLDFSPVTYCRYEVGALPGSPFAGLPNRWLKLDERDDIGEAWDAAVEWCASRVTCFDPMPQVSKAYAESPRRARWSLRLLRYTKVRRFVSVAVPSLRGPHRVVPAWLTGPVHLDKATPVLKMFAVPGWVSWIVRNRPQAIILHIVRRPAGYLDNWRDRLLLKAPSRGKVAEANRRRLRAIAASDRRWGELFGDIEVQTAEESELWFWRYSSETIHEAARSCPQYLLVNYDRFAEHPVETAKAAYAHCGLEWSAAIEKLVTRESVHSVQVANEWRRKLSRADIDLSERVLSGSVMSTWWAT